VEDVNPADQHVAINQTKILLVTCGTRKALHVVQQALINLDNGKAEAGKRKPFSAGNRREVICFRRYCDSSDNMR
jgi:hypothetical protein